MAIDLSHTVRDVPPESKTPCRVKPCTLSDPILHPDENGRLICRVVTTMSPPSNKPLSTNPAADNDPADLCVTGKQIETDPASVFC